MTDGVRLRPDRPSAVSVALLAAQRGGRWVDLETPLLPLRSPLGIAAQRWVEHTGLRNICLWFTCQMQTHFLSK